MQFGTMSWRPFGPAPFLVSRMFQLMRRHIQVMEAETQMEFVDLTAESDDEDDGTVPVTIDLCPSRGMPALSGTAGAVGVKPEHGEDPAEGACPSRKRRRNHPRSGRPEEGSLNLLQLERRARERCATTFH